MNIDRSVARLVSSVRRTAGGGTGVLVPVSGGSDSAACLRICVMALGNKAVGAFCGTELRCKNWFDTFTDVCLLASDPSWEDAEVMRWAVLQTYAKKHGLWLVGARNRTEEVLGTYSMASRVATYLPIVGLWKTEVMALCESFGVPQEITQSSRRADPDCGRPQEMAEIPLELVDAFARRKEIGEAALAKLLTPAQIAYLTEAQSRNVFRNDLPKRGPRVRVLGANDLKDKCYESLA